MPAPLTNQLVQAPTRMLIMPVKLQVLRKLADPSSKQGDLHLWRTGVTRMNMILTNDLCFFCLCQRHDPILSRHPKSFIWHTRARGDPRASSDGLPLYHSLRSDANIRRGFDDGLAPLMPTTRLQPDIPGMFRRLSALGCSEIARGRVLSEPGWCEGQDRSGA